MRIRDEAGGDEEMVEEGEEVMEGEGEVGEKTPQVGGGVKEWRSGGEKERRNRREALRQRLWASTPETMKRWLYGNGRRWTGGGVPEHLAARARRKEELARGSVRARVEKSPYNVAEPSQALQAAGLVRWRRRASADGQGGSWQEWHTTRARRAKEVARRSK
jgi:hypothetical protein